MKTNIWQNGKISTIIGIVISCILAVVQIYQGHPTIEHFVIDAAIAVIMILMNDNVFKVSSKVKGIIIDVEDTAKKLEPLIPMILQLMPSLKNASQVVLKYATDSEVKKLIDTIITNQPVEKTEIKTA
jgi:hypothetical protein